MTRTLLQQLAQIRLDEAKVLFASSQFSGAYYVAGYSIECALKSCISKSINEHEIPDKRFIIGTYTHDLKSLVKLAGLEADRAALERNDVNFATNWALVKDWNEISRYKVFTRIQAQELIDAIDTSLTNGGILGWVQQYW